MIRRTDIYSWREVRVRVRWKHIKPVFIDFGAGVVHKNAHIGLYAVTEEMARRIMLSGSVRRWTPIHYSTIVWIDLDTKDPTAISELVGRLRELGWFFTVFDSGHKGYHICFKREAVPSDELAYKDKALVREHFKDLRCYRDFDRGIYHPLHLIRGVGCYHEKSGKRKTPLCTVRGSVIPSSDGYDVSHLQRYLYERADVSAVENVWERLRNTSCFHNGPHGSRYTAIWKLAKDLTKLGLSRSQILALCEVYNDSFDNPHEHQEIQRGVADGIRAVEKFGSISRQSSTEP